MVSEIRTNRMASRAGLSTVTLTDTGPIFSGIATFTDTTQFDVNNLNAIGVITATSYTGDGSALTGIEQGVPGVSTTGTSTFNRLNVSGISTFNSNLQLGDSSVLGLGAAGFNGGVPDLRFYHNGNSSNIANNTGHLYISQNASSKNIYFKSTSILLRDTNNYEILTTANNGGITVKHNNSTKLETSASGITVTGTVAATSYTGDGSNLSGISPTPAGANTQVQYNNNGAFGASSSLTFNGSMLEVAGIVSATSSPSGTEGLRKVYASTSSPSGGADGDLWLKYDTNAASSYLSTGGGTLTGTLVVQNSAIQVTNTSASAGNYLEMKTNADSSVSLDKVGAGAFNIGGNNIYLKEDTSNTYYAGFEYNGKSFLNYSGNQKLETTSYGVLVNGEVRDSLGDLRSLPQNNTSGSYTLTASDAGKHVRATGQITVPSGTFSTGDMITIYNNSSSTITIVQGSSTTVYNSNDATTGNKTLKARGLCTILCESNNAFVASGNFA